MQRRRRECSPRQNAARRCALEERRWRVLKNAGAEKDRRGESRRQRDNFGKANRRQWRRDKKRRICLVITAGSKNGNHAFVVRIGSIRMNTFMRMSCGGERHREKKGGDHTEARERSPRPEFGSNEAGCHAPGVSVQDWISQQQSREPREGRSSTAHLKQRRLQTAAPWIPNRLSFKGRPTCRRAPAFHCRAQPE